jgi:predicted component of type VI protein secretion system
MDIRLIMFTDKGSRREFPLLKPRVLVGRTVEADLRIPLSVVSRRQCEILRQDDEVTLRDLGSSNGTLVNGVRVKQAQLSAGDRIVVGPVTFVVVVDGQPANVKPPAINGHDADRLLPAIIDEEEAGALETEPTVFQDKKEAARADRASASIERESPDIAAAAGPAGEAGESLRPDNGASTPAGESHVQVEVLIEAAEPRAKTDAEADAHADDPIAALEALARQITPQHSSQSKGKS